MKVIDAMRRNIDLSEEYKDFDATEHEQYAFIHHRGDVSHSIMKKVQAYHKRFSHSVTDKLCLNARRYLETIDKKLEYHHVHYSCFM